jgi:hypothetical protein
MSRVFDRIRKSLGLPVRIAGAAYTDEWWGDVPPAHPSIEGVSIEHSGLVLRQVDLLSLDDEVASGAANPFGHEPTHPFPPDLQESPWPPKAANPFVAPAPPKEEPSADEWESMISAAKQRAAGDATRKGSDDWDAVIGRAKRAAEATAKATVKATVKAVAKVTNEAEEDWDAIIRRAKARVA